MKRFMLGVFLAGCFFNSYATDARVIAMGRHDNFFMDETSIFRNPANINLYPNMVYGSYGVYRANKEDSSNMAALARNNRDAIDPFFGALVSYSLNQNSENRNQYPMFSFGAVFNRHDELLEYITPGTDKYMGLSTARLLAPTGKVDLMGGYVLENGGMLGIGTYLAFQSVTKNDSVQYETSIYKGTAGINWPVAKSTNLEISAAGGILRSMGDRDTQPIADPNKPKKAIFANNDIFLKGDLRLFSALTILNGDFVPHFGGQWINLKDGKGVDGGGEIKITEVNAGIGININIDKGFFWTGIEGLYRDMYRIDSTKTGIGGKVSFGIERSIFWDWFVIRVGGQKVLIYNNVEMPGETHPRGSWYENPVSDGSDNDLVGLGFGLNVENRLRIDFVAAEDIAYTFTNLVSGPQHHLFTRVSATYSF